MILSIEQLDTQVDQQRIISSEFRHRSSDLNGISFASANGSGKGDSIAVTRPMTKFMYHKWANMLKLDMEEEDIRPNIDGDSCRIKMIRCSLSLMIPIQLIESGKTLQMLKISQ